MPIVPNNVNIFDYQTPGNFEQRTLMPQDLTAMGGMMNSHIRFPESLGASKSGIPFALFAPYKRKTNFYSLLNPVDMFSSLPPPEFTIALPVPASALKMDLGVNYTQYDIGHGGGALVGVVNAAIGSGSLNLSSAIQNLVDQSLYAGLVGALSLAPGVAADELVQSALGVTANPFTEQLFKSVDFRTHLFNYTFIPKNESESRRIDAIIQIFKFYMLPAVSSGVLAGGISTAGNAFFSFPYEFQITYSVADTTFTLLPSVLEKLTVDYAGYDVPKFFNPNTKNQQFPSKINLQMQFKEMALLTRDRIALDSTQSVTTANGSPVKITSPHIEDYNARGITGTADEAAINATRYRF